MTKINKICLLVSFVILTFGFINAQTAVPSIISANQVWTPAGSPYVVSSNVILNQGYSIHVLPGTTIESTGSNKLIVDGQFIAEGTVDSIIMIDKLNFEFTKKSKGYDFAADTGSHFSYCFLKGNSVGGNISINIRDVSIYISDCKFLDHYYTVYSINSSQDTIQIKIVNSIFESSLGSNPGYAVYTSGSRTSLTMDGCIIKNQYGLILPGEAKITRSLFYNCLSYGGIRFSNTQASSLIFKCNTLRKFRNSAIEILYHPKNCVIDISNNTFDSADNFISYSLSGGANIQPIFEKNNFLTCKDYAFKFSGGNTPGLADTFDLKNNYWNTTDSAVVASKILDFSDDITIAAFSLYNPFLNSTVNVCNLPSVSVNKIDFARFNLFPNPCTQFVAFEFSDFKNKRVRIFDLQGKLLKEIETDQMTLKIDVSTFNKGIVVVELSEQGKHTAVKKLIISN